MLRIGGDSADRTWWPIAGLAAPAGVDFTLDQRWLQVTRALANGLRARLILGLNLEAGSPGVAVTEANTLLSTLGSHVVRAFELGNEPELYGRFAWYHTPTGQNVTGRPRSYDFTAFMGDFNSLAAALPRVPLAGPAFGTFAWTGQLASFLDSQPRAGVVTLHRYPLQRCFIHPSNPRYPTIGNLLAPAASTGLADRFAVFAAIAHLHKLPFRVDELNTVSCGAVRDVSQTFGSALWALDALFEFVRAGIDGVNVHTFPGAGYNLFQFTRTGGRWRASVAPEYYGLVLFARAAPPGSELIGVTGASPRLKVWATRARDGSVRVVLINKDIADSHVVAVRIPGLTGRASLERLQAPTAVSREGISLGGHSFGSTTSGTLPAPVPQSVDPSRGRYVVSLPAASAAMLTLAAARRVS